jgi:hypothetical protein
VPMLVVLNDLSYPVFANPAPPAEDVTHAIDLLVATLRAVRKHRGDVALVSEEPWSGLLSRLAPSWRADSRNRDKVRFLLALQQKAPFAKVLSGIDDSAVDYTWQGRSAAGLGAAHLVEGLAVSLALDPKWDLPQVEVDRCTLQETDDGDAVMVEDVVQVCHAFGPMHVGVHRGWICTTGLRDVSTGAQLWAERSDFFPDVRFLPRVEEQLTGLTIVSLPVVKGLLAGFQAAIVSWRTVGGTGPEPDWLTHVVPEHEQRRKLCWFDDPVTGTLDLFDQHTRFPPRPGRLHFRWDAATEKVIVAHIGRKLGV